MNRKLRFAALFVFPFLACAAGLPAQQFWRHSETAGKNSLFADIGLAPLAFSKDGLDFPFLPLDLRLEYLPPLPLPFSFGLFLKTPDPNLKSFGARLAYHFDLDVPKLDLYAAYVFDFGFIRNDVLIEYNDDPVDAHYYDFRVGVRYFFGRYIGIAVESDFKAGGVIFMVSAKIF
jgi:hypothetical protein